MEKKESQVELESLKIKHAIEELEKLKVERNIAELQKRELEKKANLKWYNNSNVIQVFATVLISVTIIGFYISYVFKPISELGITKANLEILKKEKELFNQKTELDSLSKELIERKYQIQLKDLEVQSEKKKLRVYIDSLHLIQLQKIRLLNQIEESTKRKGKNESIELENSLLKKRLKSMNDSLKTLNSIIDSAELQVMDKGSALNPEEIDESNQEEYQKLIANKFNQLATYISIISNSETSTEKSNLAIELAIDLFHEGQGTVEVQNIEDRKVRVYPIRDYLERLQALKHYYKVDLSFSPEMSIENANRLSSGAYELSTSMYQLFNAYDPSGKRVYSDVTRKRVEFIVDSDESTTPNWQVFLKNVKLIERR